MDSKQRFVSKLCVSLGVQTRLVLRGRGPDRAQLWLLRVGDEEVKLNPNRPGKSDLHYGCAFITLYTPQILSEADVP